MRPRAEEVKKISDVNKLCQEREREKKSVGEIDKIKLDIAV